MLFVFIVLKTFWQFLFSKQGCCDEISLVFCLVLFVFFPRVSKQLRKKLRLKFLRGVLSRPKSLALLKTNCCFTC